MVYLTKPEWVAHGEAGIYSLSASGDRLATGGGDQKVRVWALDSVLDDSDQAKPRLLATLADHFGSVNVVRSRSRPQSRPPCVPHTKVTRLHSCTCSDLFDCILHLPRSDAREGLGPFLL
jgi:WD40 repeat protein